MDFWLSPQLWASLQSEQTTAHAIYSSGLFKIERYGEEILDFSLAIRDKRAPRLSLEESVRNMRVLDHIRDAMKA